MKVPVRNKYSTNTIENSIHSNKNSLKSMIKVNSDNVKNPIKVDKVSNYEKTFLKSAEQSEKERHILIYTTKDNPANAGVFQFK